MRFQVLIEPELPTDSLNYHLITNAVMHSKDVDGATVEIGVRRGGGSKYIIDALVALQKNVPHFGIDPWGNIEYFADEKYGMIRQDYTNSMKHECIANLSLYAMQKNIDLYIYPMEDTEFFKKFAEGVPTYNEVKKVWNKYSTIHFDGPHNREALHEEIDFFHARTDSNATFVFDDCELYDHSEIDEYLKSLGWKVLEKGDKTATNHKMSYYKS